MVAGPRSTWRMLLAMLALVLCAACTAPAASTPNGGASSASPVPSSTASWPATTSGDLRVAALGDSVLVPPGCNCTLPVTQYAQRLGKKLGRTVVGTNLAVAGQTAAQLAQVLGTDQTTRQQVANADVVIVVTGANDVAGLASNWQECAQSCWQQPVADMGTALGQVLDDVDTLRAGKATRVLVANYWNVVSDGDVARSTEGQAYVTWGHQLTDAANAAIARQVTAHGDRLVDLQTAFRGDGSDDPTGLLASDGDHPNAAGVVAMVDAMVAATA